MNKKESTVLITGGLGFIGTRLIRLLSSNPAVRIRVLDNLSPQIHGALPNVDTTCFAKSSLEIVRGDVSDPEAIATAMIGVDAIVHLAAETGTGQSMYDIRRYVNTNVGGTSEILQWLANNKHSVKQIVLASSRAIYGEGAYRCSSHSVVYPTGRSVEQLKKGDWELVCPHCGAKLEVLPTKENAPPQPASIYASTKYSQEDLIRVAGRALGIATTILRFQNVYGAGQSLKNPYTGILSIFSTRIRRGLTLPIYEDGKESRDFVHVSDVVEAVRLAIENIHSSSLTLNVGTGIGTSVFEIASALARAFDSPVVPYVSGQYRVGDIRHCFADTGAAKQELGFEAKCSLQDGLSEFAAWVRQQPLPEDRLDAANQELSSRGLMK